MLSRVLETELMDTEDEARDYDAMDHVGVNRAFATDFLAVFPDQPGSVLDVGTGTALIPIELAQRTTRLQFVALDAASHMIALANQNVERAGLQARVFPQLANARGVPFPNQHFAAVVSNAIIHHIEDPLPIFREMIRVCRLGGIAFVRDLLRPDTEAELTHLVNRYAADANHHQRTMFADSLRAAFTLAEMQTLVTGLGFSADSVRVTSDRHWTWTAHVT